MSGHWCLVILLMAHVNYSVSDKFYNFVLFGATPKNEHQLDVLTNLTALHNVDFWRPPGQVDNPVEFMVAPDKVEDVLKTAKKSNIELSPLLDDVQSAFDKQKVRPYVHRRMETFIWSNYYELHDIYQWMQDLEQAYPDEVKIERVGRTYEHREILAAKVVLKNATEERTRVIIEGGIHAREWISPAFVTFFMDQIINSQKNGNEELANMALDHEWHFIPVANPDGYVYTHNVNRLWRKNRNGPGVDLNRNFGIAFGTLGRRDGKNNPEDDTYTGTKPFSEMESTGLANYIMAYKKDLTYYLSFHSYGQYIIIPYAYKQEHADNYEEMKLIGDKAAKTIIRIRGTKYKVGTAFETVGYKTSGVSTCWVKKTLHVPYVATFELPDDGRYGFALPTSEIVPTCQETMQGVMTLITAPCKYLRKGCSQKYMYRTSTSLGTRPYKSNSVIYMTIILFLSRIPCSFYLK